MGLFKLLVTLVDKDISFFFLDTYVINCSVKFLSLLCNVEYSLLLFSLLIEKVFGLLKVNIGLLLVFFIFKNSPGFFTRTS